MKELMERLAPRIERICEGHDRVHGLARAKALYAKWRNWVARKTAESMKDVERLDHDELTRDLRQVILKHGIEFLVGVLSVGNNDGVIVVQIDRPEDRGSTIMANVMVNVVQDAVRQQGHALTALQSVVNQLRREKAKDNPKSKKGGK